MMSNSTTYSQYPFGMIMPGRSPVIAGEEHRYGYNGMELDDEIKSEHGTSYDFGARMYDPRVGRWLSRDALAGTKPQLSPYQAFRNSPILYMDPDGNDEYISIIIKDKSGKTLHTIRGHEAISNKVRAGAIREAGNSVSVYETQNFYDFRTVYTATMNEDGNLEIDPTPVYYTLTDRKRYSKTMFSSILSGYKTGAIIDPDAPGFDWTLEGNGENQKGGYTLTSKGGGASPTKTRSLTPAEERDIGELLDVLGTSRRGSLGNRRPDQLNDIENMFEKADDIAKENQGGNTSSDEMSTPKNNPKIEVDTLWSRDGKDYYPLKGESEPANPVQNKENRKKYYEKHNNKAPN